jgi:AcrR family transcriptional regulator
VTDPAALPPVDTRTTGAAGRVRMTRTARRAQLLDAALEIFVAQGYHAAAMDDIADHAGVSKPVLYQHFPGKLDLYLALLDRSADALVATVREALVSTSDNHARVSATIRAYLRFVDGEGTHRLVFESDLRSEPRVAERVDRMMWEAADLIADTVAADTGLASADARLIAVGLAGMAEVAARWRLDSHSPVSQERAVELLGHLAWRGISGYPRQD